MSLCVSFYTNREKGWAEGGLLSGDQSGLSIWLRRCFLPFGCWGKEEARGILAQSQWEAITLGIIALSVKGKIPFVSSFAGNTVGRSVQLIPVDEEVLGQRGLSLGCREEASGYSLGC